MNSQRSQPSQSGIREMISPLDKDLALIYPWPIAGFFQELAPGERHRLIHVLDEKYDTMGSNVLTLSPRKVLVVDGNPKNKSGYGTGGKETFEAWIINNK